jgi:transposase InsO family protein
MTQYTKDWIIRQRYLMIKKYQAGMKVTQICKEHDISRKTFYKWLKRYNTLGKEGLLDQSRRPKSAHPKSLPLKVVKAVVRIRKKRHFGPKRIKLELAKKGLKASEHGIYKILLRYKLIEKHKRRKKKPKKYYVTCPGYLQIDTKHLDTLPGYPYRFYQYTAVDSYTRMRVIRIYEELSSFNSVRFLKEVVNQLPFRVIAVRTDNGVEFTYGPFKKDHPFTQQCARLGIRHHLNKPSHPESNGRVERSHRTDEEEFYRVNPVKTPHEWVSKIRKWEHFYNYQRPHQALANLTPYQFFLTYKREVQNVT